VNIRLKVAVPLAAAALLGGCVTAQQQQMKAALDPYVGQSVASFAALRGPPTSMVRTGDNEAAFRWVITGQGVGGIVPMGTSLVVVPAGPRVCTVALTATTAAKDPDLKDWTITNWQWQGAC
jgi:hypothetical protein